MSTELPPRRARSHAYYRLDRHGRPTGPEAEVGGWQYTGAFTTDPPPGGHAAPGTHLGSGDDDVAPG